MDTKSNITNNSSSKVEIFKSTDIDKHWCEFKLKYNKIYNDCSIEQER